MKKMIIFFIPILFWLAAIALADGSSLEANFNEGNREYKNADYQKAIISYETVLKQGYESGALYYNLGNSYFKAGNLGKAVLNYERAEQFIPRDGDLKANYNFARSLITNETRDANKSFLERLMKKYYSGFTFDELAKILLSVYILLGALYLLSLFFRWPRSQTVLALIVVGAYIVLNLFSFYLKINDARNSAIILSKTDATFEPSSNSTIHFTLPEGSKIRVIEVMGLWAKIERADGKIGWVEAVKYEKI